MGEWGETPNNIPGGQKAGKTMDSILPFCCSGRDGSAQGAARECLGVVEGRGVR